MKYGRSKSILSEPFIYCPGCSHGIIHRLVAESIDELDIQGDVIGISSIGCSVRIWKFLDYDWVQGAHGRGMAVATGIKRAKPSKVIFTYQGDGDLAAIGMAETIHAAARGEKITVIFVNNGVFGATGGQLAPTTLVNQITSTTPEGRNPDLTGKPIRMAEQLSTIESASYIARVSVHDPGNILKAKKAVKKAFENQLNGGGFSMVEILATCPSNLKLSPVDSLKWLEENMLPYYPIGEFKTPGEVI
jgi:2-oxoglutarate ferredoxin oxidoreductase subunit beta